MIDDVVPSAEAIPEGSTFDTGGYPAPWIDTIASDSVLNDRVEDRPIANLFSPRALLVDWWRNGFVILPSCVDGDVIDAYLRDLEAFCTRRPTTNVVQIQAQKFNQQLRPASDFTREELRGGRNAKFVGVHQISSAARRLMLTSAITEFLALVFAERAVALQSLTFIRGSEQPNHADYAYVHYQKSPWYLAASWIALEDVHLDAGPLAYFPGSHRLPRFDWGNGILLTPESSKSPAEFGPYLDGLCARAGLRKQTLLIRRGDALIWHAALCHEGTRINDPALTRKSLVTHYTSGSCYPESHSSGESFATASGLIYRYPWTRGDPDADSSWRAH
jgi:ectoine hydroxylase-related dioxygenase (phytanoyl-CoA dioxygenase family)